MRAVTEVDIINPEAQAAYLPKVGEVIRSTGGTYLARGGKIVALEGELPKRVTIVVYDSLPAATGVPSVLLKLYIYGYLNRVVEPAARTRS